MTQHRKYRFALVGHSKELAEAVMAGVDHSREELICKVVKMGEAVPVAKSLFSQGVEAIFGHMGNSRLMLHATGKPIIHIPRTRLDLIRALKKAKQYGTTIGLSSFSKPTDGIDIIEDLLDIHIRQIIFNSADELEESVKREFEAGLKVVVGGGISTTLMKKLGGHGILSLPREHVINQAFDQARIIAAVNRKDQAQKQRLSAILQMMDDGIIGTDQYGRLNIFNRAAEKLLGLEKESFLDQAFHKIANETRLNHILTHGESEKDTICNINGVDVVVSAMPITINGKSQGAVALFRAAQQIQNINRKVKERLYSRGFTTRYTIDDICGRTPAIRSVIDKATKYAATGGNILIQGETGTGKELIAQSIHQLSDRKNQPFVAINCGAIPDTLIESELFGHEEGAFTGAKRGGKIGLIELADKGTLFLNEIADVSRELQIRLLRVIENKEVMRVGGSRYVKIDVRVISSSYKDLRMEISTGGFRPDLYYRLATLKLFLPPLRDRLEDIPLIIGQYARQKGKNKTVFTRGMEKELQSYSWPGNVRELVSFAESYFIMLGNREPDEALFHSLFEELTGKKDTPPPPENLFPGDDRPIDGKDTLKSMVEKYEQFVIQNTLELCRFSRQDAADRLGISINTLWRKMRKQLTEQQAET